MLSFHDVCPLIAMPQQTELPTILKHCWMANTNIERTHQSNTRLLSERCFDLMQWPSQIQMSHTYMPEIINQTDTHTQTTTQIIRNVYKCVESNTLLTIIMARLDRNVGYRFNWMCRSESSNKLANRNLTTIIQNMCNRNIFRIRIICLENRERERRWIEYIACTTMSITKLAHIVLHSKAFLAIYNYYDFRLNKR